jgi:hypothetical protein
MTSSLVRFALVLAAIGLPAAYAQAEIYRCESDSGVPLYQNAPGKNCKKLDLTPVSTIPTPKATVAKSTGASSAAPSRVEFPKVDSSSQGARDSDKRRILDEELKKEEARLADLRKEYNGGDVERRADERNFEKYQTRVQKIKDDLARAESNVKSLRTELDTAKN